MCGIAAIIGLEDLQLRESLVQEMGQLMRHRGPDGEGLLSIHSLSLGHRRLAILDLSDQSNQPMTKGHYHMVFNGEIYNYIELRKELEKLGHNFHTSSDSEVLLAAFVEWGKKCLSKLNGMFAFLIYDEKTRTLFGARDRFGEKPLYIWKSSLGFFAFASEIKAFTPLPGWKPRLHHEQAYHYLNWGLTDHTAETMFEGVHQLLGGESFTLRNGKLSVERWYNLQPQCNEEFHFLFEDSIRLRLRSDVPIGSCLSGGIDSSSIVCFLGELGEKPSTFSACFPHPRIDEKPYMEAVVERVGGPAHYITPKKEDLLSQLETIIWMHDLPFGSTSIFAQWEVFKKASEAGVKVMLDGQGADEQFGGYQGSYLKLFQEYLRRGKLMQAAMNFPYAVGLPLLGKCVPKPLKNPLKRLLKKNEDQAGWVNFTKLQTPIANPFEIHEKGTFEDYRAAQLLTTSLPMLLRYEDRDSMAHSIEARTPFLDHRLVECSLGLSPDRLIHRGRTKIALRESLKSVLPKKIYERRTKLGFETPEEEWMAEFPFEKIEERSQGVIRRIPSHSRHSFRAICFTLWLEKFEVHV